ncbi:MAG: hypothetical protein K6G27_11980 [Lachnospiraceae bacterium]|nr:hypothetical protein [Lachnospiraceae bacterium]
MNKLTLEKALLAGVVVAMIVVKGTVLRGVEVEARASKYGPVPVEPVQPRQMTEEEKEAAEERSSNDRARVLAAEHEAGMANGTAGEALAPEINGSRSTVKGCYNTRKSGMSFSVSGEGGDGARGITYNPVDFAVGLGPNEENYAYIMDSQCGDAAKAVLNAEAVSHGYPAGGPVIDINIGKKTEAGTITYPSEFNNNGVIGVSYKLPSGYLMPGYEPAFICLLPDGSTEIGPNMHFDFIVSNRETGLLFVDHPEGVYMLTQVPEGSLKALHDAKFQKMLSFSFYCNSQF